MARSITLTLGAGLGADLGPNFNLTANVGSVTPSTATKSELTAGKSVSVDDAATQVTITSTGTCTNAITQTIPCGGTTTTTTEPPTTTTTTTAAPTCNYYNIEGAPSIDVEWVECDGTPNSDTVTTAITICAQTDSVYQTGGAGNITELGACSSPTTTTTDAPTTTSTTTAGITYDNYYADEYDCATCTLQATNVQIAFPTGTPVTVGKWYAPLSLNGNSYQLASLTLQSGPGLVMYTSEFNNCGMACII
jgi:hypothetical protein